MSKKFYCQMGKIVKSSFLHNKIHILCNIQLKIIAIK